ncbi:MAG: terpene cyclase/mutase family protein [Pirellulales bacterium]|nr:terpene cyclase/mutase family protein [Pirellulales bacterium]
MNLRITFFRICLPVLVGMVGLIGCNSRRMVEPSPPQASSDDSQIGKATDRALKFLEQAQEKDGSFSSAKGTGITSLVVTALLRSGHTAEDATVARALRYLQSNRHDDGGIYAPGSNHKNYETCLAMVALQGANHDGQFAKVLAGAEAFVKKQQWDEGEGKDLTSEYYGGAGYGSHERPDLSNTSFLIEALKAVGRGDEDPAIQKALIFVSRCQNLESPSNTTAFAGKVNDGGFYYTVAAGGQSMAGQTPEGGLRSYGSMTYAGFKSMIYAGLTRDDPRVKIAYAWIQKNYTLAENPGMGDAGLYYYYHMFAKALDAVGEDLLVDSQGRSHDWRAELAEELLKSQAHDGSWANGTPRWSEDDRNLVTSYALLCLSYCQPADAK